MDFKKGMVIFVVGMLIVGVIASFVSAINWPAWAIAVLEAIQWIDSNQDAHRVACGVDSMNRNEHDRQIESSWFPYVTAVCDDLVNRGRDRYAMYAAFKVIGQSASSSKLQWCRNGANAYAKVRVLYMTSLTTCT